ncbi:hypothetical protein QJU43_04215 [Pasteurella atlantica]|uniref:hypothetical protein n=1 Tax=Pasteurellaceae TaxID=712 RepID=UPI00276EE205|nr:hypothetical protein [Pasteurella atlantica]MDP8033671.1 hypothetical protein [Pasteurella atlantica]MDP8035549.1 hypothetical protein [Pasteurella atlantica]MDP8037500.1 hypothetical protein [Pasteurella atlantica]MDP8047849.1 hypothetical protein [Pasteurella atlantica]MDP8049804.1 hypothetical protein [Pasteurella atlantica]
MKLENLTNQEFEQLKNYKNKMVRKVLGISLFSAAIFLVIFSIPKRFLPIKSFYLRHNLDLNLFQSQGIVICSVIIIAVTLLMFVMAYFYYRLPKLAKDIKESKKVKLQVTITKIEKPSPSLEQMDISFKPSYNSIKKILFIEKINLFGLKVGQKVEIVATKNALYPFSISSVAE